MSFRPPSPPELCAKCGEPIWSRQHPALRLCGRHTLEHLASIPPFACTTEDIDAGYEPTEDQIEMLVAEAEAARATVTDLSTRSMREEPR